MLTLVIMPHAHIHEVHRNDKAFMLGIGLNLGFVLIELFYGVLADSLALIADAGHNFSDVVSLVLAWGAMALAARTPTPRRTYGFRRVTILASLSSAILLLVAIGSISWAALARFSEPSPVAGMTVIIVAAIGVVINTVTALMFLSGQQQDLNIKAAFLHMAADAGVSLGVVLAGFAILLTGWTWLDPMISLVIAVIILIGTWALLRDSMTLAIDSVPKHIDPLAVENYLRAQPEVTDLHDLHIWAMSTTEVALTAHLVVPLSADNDVLLERIACVLHQRFGVGHPTLQIERGNGENCQLAPPESL